MTIPTDSPPAPAPDLIPAAADFRWRVTGADVVALVILLLGSIAIYGRTVGFAFLQYDDAGYVYENSHVLAGLSMGNLGWASRAVVLGNYHPLTELVWLAISSVAGTRPGPFHLVNAALHTANVGLMFVFLRRTAAGFWPAALASALWGWHPLRVESVAWVSELKDILCGTFTLLTLIAYARYAGRRTPARYAAVAALLALAMLAKPMAVTVPAVLLLLDYWPLGRADRRADRAWWLARLGEKLPLAALTVADIAYQLKMQTVVGSTGPLALFPVGARVANAVVSTAEYLRQTACPTGLAVFYPHPAITGASHPLWSIALSVAVVLAVTAAAAALRHRVPAVAVGWLWFLVMLVPVIGLVQVGAQARADRYTYLPAIGLTVAVVWALAALRPPGLARLAGALGGAAAAALLAASVTTVAYWRDTYTLFSHAEQVVPDNFEAMLIVADVLLAKGDVAGATPRARHALELTGDRIVSPRVTLGVCLLATDRDADVTPALEQFVTAVKLRKIEPLAWVGMGRALTRQAAIFTAQGRKPEVVKDRIDHAIGAYRQALRLDPDEIRAANLLARLLDDQNRPAEALDVWRYLLGRFPNDPVGNGDLAAALQKSGDLEGATEHYLIAIENGDSRPATASKLAGLLAISGNSTPDQLAFIAPLAQRACDDPVAGGQPYPWYAYSIVLARLDRTNDAVAAGERALALAKATGNGEMATAIQNRLTAYRQGLVALPATRPTTAPVFDPTTRQASTAPGR